MAFAARSRQYRHVSHAVMDHAAAQLPAHHPRRGRLQPARTPRTGQVIDSGAEGFGRPSQYGRPQPVAHRVCQVPEADHKCIDPFRQIDVFIPKIISGTRAEHKGPGIRSGHLGPEAAVRSDAARSAAHGPAV
jgi:hypothetical protein